MYTNKDIFSGANLIERLKENDQKAFCLLYDLYYLPMFNFAVRYVKDEKIAQDVIQDVFIKIWQQRNGLKPELPIQRLLFKILRNELLNTIRGRKRELSKILKAFENGNSNQNFTELSYRKSHFMEIFRQGINALSQQKRKIFTMHNLHGISSKKIADDLGISENTVKSQYTKANNFLKEYLRQYI